MEPTTARARGKTVRPHTARCTQYRTVYAERYRLLYVSVRVCCCPKD